MHAFDYFKKTLHCEEVDLQSLVEEIGTPVYVYSAAAIRDHFNRLDHAFGMLDHMICYAAKANSNLALLRLLAAQGAGFDIVSGGELFKVLKAGGRADRCTFAGVGKMEHEIKYALEQGIYSFNVESEEELEFINAVAEKMGRIAPIALRVNPDVDVTTHHYIATGKSKNKFGIGLDRAEAVYERAATLSHLNIKGLQTHIGSQILDPASFVEALQKLTPLILRFKEKYALEFFSMGGGLGIVYQNALGSASKKDSASLSAELTPENYAAALRKPLQQLGLRILFEPGRFIVGNAGVLLTKALYRKETPAKKFLIVDAGMNDLIRPALYQGHHEVEPLREPEGNALELVDVVGPVCESGDFFAQDRMMPPVAPGEYVALMSAGAYGFAMASTYNARPLPPEVLVDGATATIVRRRQTWEDLVKEEE